jgi:aspartate/methionine/tyrosine aminotransferase
VNTNAWPFAEQLLRLASAGSLPTSTGNRDLARQSRLLVDFSHGDVAAFPPHPRVLADAVAAFSDPHSAYSPYRGHGSVREKVAANLKPLIGREIDSEAELIITPGTQAGVYLALSSLVGSGDIVAIANPDYFAYARIVTYLGARPRYVNLRSSEGVAQLDIEQLKVALAEGARVICLSNPNNPTGAVYDSAQFREIADLCERWDAYLISDELYSRLDYGGVPIAHAWSTPGLGHRSVSLLGPSKTESLSGFRVGTAIAAPQVIDGMEQIQSIVSLRAPGYSQAVLAAWLEEEPCWLSSRVEAHREIRDAIVSRWLEIPGLDVSTPRAGSYLFPRLPALAISPMELFAALRNDAGIIVTPGAEFGPGGEESFRINFSQHAEVAIAAVNSIAEFIARVAR